MKRGRWPETDEERFYNKVKKTKSCWVWQGARTKKYGGKHPGYGTVYYKTLPTVAHRVSYMIHSGEIPNGVLVLHKCDNTLCVNPDHLFLGSQSDNINDMMEKGRGKYNPKSGENHWSKTNPEKLKNLRRGNNHPARQPEKYPGFIKRGEQNKTAKITKKEVVEIRRIHEKKKLSQVKLSKIFNISTSQIHRIITREAWGHVK